MKNKKTLILLLFIASILIAKDNCVHVKYIETQKNTANKMAEVFFDPLYGMYLMISDPIVQNVRMNPEEYIYFYPQENMAMIMNNRDGVLASAPLQLFLYAGSEDMGISGLGFELKEHYLKSDTLVKIWELKGEKKQEYLRIEAFHSKDHLLKTMSYNSNNDLMKLVEFKEWQELNNYSYPMQLIIMEEERKSHYNFQDLYILKDIPDSVKAKFTIPKDCVIYEYKL